MSKLNELKVAEVLLRSKSEAAEVAALNRQLPELMDSSMAFDTLATIAGELAEAPYMFRGDRVMGNLRDLLTTVAGMDDLYDEVVSDE